MTYTTRQSKNTLFLWNELCQCTKTTSQFLLTYHPNLNESNDKKSFPVQQMEDCLGRAFNHSMVISSSGISRDCRGDCRSASINLLQKVTQRVRHSDAQTAIPHIIFVLCTEILAQNTGISHNSHSPADKYHFLAIRMVPWHF